MVNGLIRLCMTDAMNSFSLGLDFRTELICVRLRACHKMLIQNGHKRAINEHNIQAELSIPKTEIVNSLQRYQMLNLELNDVSHTLSPQADGISGTALCKTAKSVQRLPSSKISPCLCTKARALCISAHTHTHNAQLEKHCKMYIKASISELAQVVELEIRISTTYIQAKS